LFGTGGQLVEVFKDQAIALPPLNSSLARRLMEQTTIHRALQGVRGRKAVDLEALEQLLVAFSQLVTDNPRIKEIDINPLLVSPERIISLDARIVLHPPELANEDLPRTTIRPYPQQYTSHFQLKNQTDVTIRPIRPEDEPAVIKFHETLSQESVYFRYFHMIKLAQLNTHERLTRMCFIDYDREMAVVVMNQAQDIIGIGRLSKLHGINEAEFALMIADSYQCQGIGTKVLETMVTIARNEKIERITAEVLRDNGAMQRVFQKNGFTIKKSSDIVHACLEL
jgi:acetyltransferase